MRRTARLVLALACAGVLGLTGCSRSPGAAAAGPAGDARSVLAEHPAEHPAARRSVGLFTTLPILWGEAGDPRELLAEGQARHWLPDALPDAALTPLDVLADAQGRVPLAPGGTLIMAQPRSLAPVENVALDGWVRGGGRLLLFADPMLTAHSRFALGDPRRPQAVVLLSPILAHWRLALEFPEDQPAGERMAALAGMAVPVDLAGRFVLVGENPGCSIADNGLVADCVIGKGRVLAIADAALLEDSVDSQGRARRSAVLAALLHRLDLPR